MNNLYRLCLGFKFRIYALILFKTTLLIKVKYLPIVITLLMIEVWL